MGCNELGPWAMGTDWSLGNAPRLTGLRDGTGRDAELSLRQHRFGLKEHFIFKQLS